jgi:MATE family multidrug resistance protein
MSIDPELSVNDGSAPGNPRPAESDRVLLAPLRREDLRNLLALALPVVAIQLGLMAMGAVDTIMVGHLSAEALAAVALGNLYFFAVAIFGMGTLMALDPVVSQAVGAGDQEAIARSVQRGALLAALLCIPVVALLLPAGPVLVAFRQPPAVAALAAAYARTSIPGVLGLFGFLVLRTTLQAMGRMTPVLAVIVIANLVNAGLNWLLIFGHFGLPPLGVVGSAWATVISRWLMALLLLVLAWPQLRPYLRPLRPAVLQRGPLLRLLALGSPIGIQQQLEYGVFGVVGLFMGWLGTTAMAGHQVALNLASLTFMVPLGIATAASVAVGQAIGRGDALGARGAARAALAIGLGFMSLSATSFMLFPSALAGLYTPDRGVVAIAATLIPIAGVFQVFDGLQVVSIGVLRGMGDTRTPMLMNILGFWLLGLPVSLYLGVYAGFGPRGLWWGLTVGLIVVAITLVWRVRTKLGREFRRIVIDLPESHGAAATPFA